MKNAECQADHTEFFIVVKERQGNDEKIIYTRKSPDTDSGENSVSEAEKELARHDRSLLTINVTALHRPSSEQSSSKELKKSESTLSTHSSIQSGSLPVADSLPSFQIDTVKTFH